MLPWKAPVTNPFAASVSGILWVLFWIGIVFPGGTMGLVWLGSQ